MNFIGTDGSDKFTTNNNGNDTYNAKKGNDFVKDYSGDDIYIFNRGDGCDQITDSNGFDKIEFGQGITLNDMEFSRSFGNMALLMKIKGTSDAILVLDYFKYDRYKIENIVFDDGTILTVDDIERLASSTIPTDGNDTLYGDNNPNTIHGLGGNDIIYGLGADDFLYGDAGNDQVYGEDGNDTLFAVSDYSGGLGDDTLAGGKGNDSMYGGSGNTTYLFNKGDGQDYIFDMGNISLGQPGTDIDTIKFGAGITKDDLEFDPEVTSLVIKIKNSTDQIFIEDWGDYEAHHNIEQLEFADGSILNSAQIEALIKGKNFEGTDQDDNLTGTFKDDTFNGKKGNDSFIDAGGNDVYTFNKGDGQDIIRDWGLYSKNDVIKFGLGINSTDLLFTKNGDDLVVTFNGSTDKIVVKDWYYTQYQNPEYYNPKIEKLEFSDGTSLSATDIDNIVNGVTLSQPQPLGSQPAASVIATDGNDKLFGYNGNDIYLAMKGADIIKDYSGNDTYLFNKGDGLDVITDNSGADTIKFNDIALQDLSFVRNNNNLNLNIKGTADSITMVDWFSASKYQIENIVSADGSSLSNSQINQLVVSGKTSI